MFDAGLDTAAIAGRLFEREASVATAVRLGREARRGADNASRCGLLT